MPSIRTLVRDLNSGEVGGIGRKPPSHQNTTHSLVSAQHKITFQNLNIKASLSTGRPVRLSCDKATSIDINGTYLHFQDGWTTITKLDVLRPVAVSGNFSGCAYHVYRSGQSIYCCHIARAGGEGSDANVALMREYAGGKGWSLVHDLGTRGRVGKNGCSEVILVSQLVGQQVDSIRLEVNSMGLIVRKTLVQTPLLF